MEKQIAVVVAASGEIKDMAITPGATVKEILDEAGLTGYQLLRKGEEPLSAETDLYEESADGEKFYASPVDVSVGSEGGGSASPLRIPDFIGMLDDLAGHRKVYLPKNQGVNLFFHKRIKFIGNRHFEPSVQLNGINSAKKEHYQKEKTRITKLGRDLPYWEERGWQKRGGTYKGLYNGEWYGLIEENYRGSLSFHIFNPPEFLKNTTHWSCFVHKGNGKYGIHFSRKPQDVSSGIISVEKLINEASNNGGASWISKILNR